MRPIIWSSMSEPLARRSVAVEQNKSDEGDDEENQVKHGSPSSGRSSILRLPGIGDKPPNG